MDKIYLMEERKSKQSLEIPKNWGEEQQQCVI